MFCSKSDKKWSLSSKMLEQEQVEMCRVVLGWDGSGRAVSGWVGFGKEGDF